LLIFLICWQNKQKKISNELFTFLLGAPRAKLGAR